MQAGIASSTTCVDASLLHGHTTYVCLHPQLWGVFSRISLLVTRVVLRHTCYSQSQMVMSVTHVIVSRPC